MPLHIPTRVYGDVYTAWLQRPLKVPGLCCPVQPYSSVIPCQQCHRRIQPSLYESQVYVNTSQYLILDNCKFGQSWQIPTAGGPPLSPLLAGAVGKERMLPAAACSLHFRICSFNCRWKQARNTARALCMCPVRCCCTLNYHQPQPACCAPPPKMSYTLAALALH